MKEDFNTENRMRKKNNWKLLLFYSRNSYYFRMLSFIIFKQYRIFIGITQYYFDRWSSNVILS
jgi:hypothetical protein